MRWVVINNINGWIILDKQTGITSRQAVTKISRILNIKKIGHGGTLDPMATGVLPIAVG
jgi:tRNA pseudouridine55 synthase